MQILWQWFSMSALIVFNDLVRLCLCSTFYIKKKFGMQFESVQSFSSFICLFRFILIFIEFVRKDFPLSTTVCVCVLCVCGINRIDGFFFFFFILVMLFFFYCNVIIKTWLFYHSEITTYTNKNKKKNRKIMRSTFLLSSTFCYCVQ